MADVKLFITTSDGMRELSAEAPQIEKTLQISFERNLDTLLGVKFLATEYSTGPVHGGRIDTLGIDEDGSPVIIEYKRSLNENVINQGLFYLDWLMDHRGDFELLVMKTLGPEASSRIEWSSPRLICIAGDFTRYDTYAVKQINRNIELLRYRRFQNDLLLIELVHAPKVAARVSVEAMEDDPKPSSPGGTDPYRSQRIDYRLANASPELRAIWDAVETELNAFGDDVQTKQLKYYVAFKRIKNFVCLELYPSGGSVVAYAKVDPDTVALEEGFTRDVRKVGHFGTGDLEIILRSTEDVARALPLLQRAYEGG